MLARKQLEVWTEAEVAKQLMCVLLCFDVIQISPFSFNLFNASGWRCLGLFSLSREALVFQFCRVSVSPK